MYLGYVINDETLPLLQPLKDADVKRLSGDKPTLIVGYEKAVSLFPDQISFTSKVIDKDKRIYYCFSEEESDDQYAEDTVKFLKKAFQETIENFEVKNIVDLENIDDFLFEDEEVFLHETPKFLTITCKKIIYYFNKEVTSFFNKLEVDADYIKALLADSDVVSWDQPRFFGAVLKNNMVYKSKQQLRHLLRCYGDVDLYMGALCLKWLQELEEDDDETVWQRAYETEAYLSSIKIKIDKKRLRKLSYLNRSATFANALKRIENGYIVQNYNGTDKITGRMYPKGAGFSIQTLTQDFRDIVVVEKDCYLVEFDYQYFEYSLLAQLCGFKSPKDPHLHLAKQLFGDEKYRPVAKSINYSVIYGKALNKVINEVVEEYDISFTKQEFREKLEKTIEPIQKLKEKLEEEYEREGYITNPFDRKIFSKKQYALLNNYVQSAGAEIVIIKLLKIRDYLSKYDPMNKIVLQNHDSILLNLRIDDVEETSMAKDLKDILESKERDLSGTTSLKCGFDWKNLE